MMSYFIALVRSDVLNMYYNLHSCCLPVKLKKKKKKTSSKLAATGLTDMTSSVKEDNKGAAHLIFNVVIHLT